MDKESALELIRAVNAAVDNAEDVERMSREEVRGYLLSAHKSHITPVAPFATGLIAIEVNTDVTVLSAGKVLPKGVYHLLKPENEEQAGQEQYSWLLTFTLDEESVRADLERAEAEGRVDTEVLENGTTQRSIRGTGQIRMNLAPVELYEGKTATYDDLLVGLAIDDVLKEGGIDKAVSFIYSSNAKGNQQEEAPKLEAIAPEKHVVPNSKVTHVLRHGNAPLLFEQGGQPVKVDKRNTQIQFALWPDEDASIEVSEDIDAEDVAIIEAVATLKHAGNTVITPGQIIRNMGYGRPTPELVEEVHRRVLNLMSVKGRIDWTKQAKAWNLRNPDTGEPYEHAELIGNLLSMVVFDATDVKGNRDIRYKVAADPITYEHARLVHQVIEYPPSLLDLAPIDEDGNEVRRVNRNQNKLERAVLWYVFSLKNPKNGMSNYVTYEALFDYEGVTIGSRSARNRAIKFIHAYLRALQKAGVIYAFEPKIEQSRRHLQAGVTLFVEKPRKKKGR